MDCRRPTDHTPGSAGKIKVMRQRATRQLPLFMDGDNSQVLVAEMPRSTKHSTAGIEQVARDCQELRKLLSAICRPIDARKHNLDS